MIKKIAHIAFGLLLGFSQSVFSQDGITSSQQWFSFELQKKFDNLTLSAEEGWRVQELYMSLNNYTELGATYKFNKFVRAGGSYRMIFQNSYFDIENVDHRFTADLGFRYEVEQFTFGYKTRLQHRVRGGFAPGLDGRSKSYNRNEFGVSFDAGDIEFKASWETYLRLTMAEKFIDQHRFQVGAEYKINKNNSISLHYLYQKEVNVYEPWKVHTLIIGYSMEL